MFVIRGRRIVVPNGERAAAIHIDGERISRIAEFDDVDGADDVIEAGDLLVLPGLVDSHVHVNEPGRTDWEGFATATRAAAAGGVTTIVDMPLNSIPATTTVDALEQKRRAARGQCLVDVAFWGGIVPGNEAEIAPLIDAGVRGFKCFLTPSGVDEFENVAEADLRRALPAVATAGRSVPVLVHAEDPALLRTPSGDPRRYATWLASRPPAAEASAVRLVASLAADSGVHAHIVHLSSAEGVDAVRAAQQADVHLTAETCPHYLAIKGDEIADAATPFKCAPPVRSWAHAAALWSALDAGVCSMIVTDHSPAPPPLKEIESGDFVRAWGGIASLELSLRIMFTEMEARQYAPFVLARWMCEQPARLAGLREQKGSIRVGADADVVIYDPGLIGPVRADRLQQRHKVTPYAGRVLVGRVRATYLRGRCIWRDDAPVGAPQGQLL